MIVSSSRSLLRAEAVTKRFKKTLAVDGVTLDLHGGLVTALAGPDGAGKTTLMRLLAGLFVPESGTVEGFGADSVKDPETLRSHLGYMPQSFGLYEDLTVLENLTLYARLKGVSGTTRAQRFERLLSFTNLAPFQDRLAGALSGGMKQKLGLACTLVSPPDLLLLDEPSVGVDPASRRELWAMVQTLVKEEGMGVLWSTAYLDEVEKSDRALVLSHGRLIFEGNPADFTTTMEGRSFLLKGSPLPIRRLQRQVLGRPGVVDALPHGASLRVVLAENASSDIDALLGPSLNDPNVAFLPASPCFEDAYVSALREGRAMIIPDEESCRDSSETDANSPQPIVIENLCKTFGSFKAVDQVSFSVSRGEVFGLLGPNGAGKSTTFKMLCGLLEPTSGHATVAGVDLRSARAKARERLGYMAQKFSLYGNLSAAQNLKFFAGAYGLRGAEARTRIQAVSEEFGLLDCANEAAGDLPLGYKQRLSLAAAVMHEPDILFLDEPTSGVDPLTRREFWVHISAMADRGVTVLVTTHFMEEAEYCDRILIIMNGQAVALGAPEDLKRKTVSPTLPDPTMEDAFIALVDTFTNKPRRDA